MLIFFHISAQNIDCGYPLEPPRRGGSKEYQQSMLLSRNKKNNVYPCKPQIYYIKVGFKGGQNYIGMFSCWVHLVLQLQLKRQPPPSAPTFPTPPHPSPTKKKKKKKKRKEKENSIISLSQIFFLLYWQFYFLSTAVLLELHAIPGIKRLHNGYKWLLKNEYLKQKQCLSLAHVCMKTPKSVSGKQCRPRSDRGTRRLIWIYTACIKYRNFNIVIIKPNQTSCYWKKTGPKNCGRNVHWTYLGYM